MANTLNPSPAVRRFQYIRATPRSTLLRDFLPQTICKAWAKFCEDTYDQIDKDIVTVSYECVHMCKHRAMSQTTFLILSSE